MSLVPHVYNELLDVPSTRYHFGNHFNPDTVWPLDLPVIHPNRAGYLRPWVNNSNLTSVDGAEKKTHIGKDGFQVSLDVQHFSPNEITVKTIDNSIIVQAQHEERQDDHGYISRQFTRRYDLPQGFKAEDVVSSISSDGVLTVKAPPVNAAIEGNVRHVAIQQTGPAHFNIAKYQNK